MFGLVTAGALQGVVADGSVGSVLQAEGGVVASALGQRGDCQRFEEFDAANDAVAASVLPCSAGTATD